MEALFSDYETIRKSGLFDPEYYLAAYPDVGERNLDPLVHYLEEGARQGRDPCRDFDSAFYLEQCRERGEQPGNPLIHYIRIGAARGFKTKPDSTARDLANGARLAERQPAAPERPGRLPILVALESLGVVGGAGGSLRLSASGWALATAPIVEITVSLHGDVIGTASYGLPRPDIGRLYPDREGAAQCGFLLSVDLPGGVTGAIEPLLRVRTADEEIGQRALRVEIPPQQLVVEALDPLDPGQQGPDAGSALRLGIDRVEIDRSGILRVEGWLVCRVQIETVEAFIDDMRIGPAEFGRVRADIEEIHPDYPNSRFAGFTLATDARSFRSGRKTLRVRASARAGIVEQATAPVTIPARLPAVSRPVFPILRHWDEITLTTAGQLVVKGWAVGVVPTAAIVVLLDNNDVGEAELRLDRPDLGNRFPALIHARQSGFALDARVAKAIPGQQHRVTIRIRLENGQTHEEHVPVAACAPRGGADYEISGTADRKLHLDTPQVVDGVVETPFRGNLEITGWALARAGVAAIEIAINGTPVALAHYGSRRLDIQAAFPDWTDALTCGFSSLLPHRILPIGEHTVCVTLRDKAGQTTRTEFRIEVEEPSETAGPWSLRRKIGQAELDLAERILQSCVRKPMFAALLPVKSDRESLRRARVTIASLCAQAYPHWRLLILPAAGGGKSVGALIAEMGPLGERAELLSELTAESVDALAARLSLPASDLFVTVLSAGDELGCDAFLETALALGRHQETDFLYSDERSRNPASGAIEAYFKPQWSPDLFLSTNYVGRLWCARADLIAAAVEHAERLLDRGEYDLVLRCTEQARAIRHVPAVLCERAPDAGESALLAKAALQGALSRRGIAGRIKDGLVPGTYRVERALTRPGLVSIIIPTCAAQGMIEKCIGTLRQLTAYRDYEIICIENIPPSDRKWREWLRRNADRVVSTKGPFNWSRFNNLAVAHARGEYLLLLNDDIEIIEPDWLDILVEQAQRPEIGVVGPRLLYPDRRVQHAGMFLAAPGQARHAFRYAAEDDSGYFGLAATTRNVIAVTGACLMTRRDTFDRLGGLDETHAIVNNDVDYCLRAWRSGLLNIYTPHATLIHHETASRAALDDEYDVAAFDGEWRDLFLAGDPYFNPHLSKKQDIFAADHEPTRLLVTGRPALPRDEIRKILLVKLDHIGDAVISFPAVRRLRQYFPHAHLTVLTSRASRPIWALEPSIDATIEFDFFHARSGLGELERTEEDWRQLRERLAVERFDLAIDLRKHIDTRPVLQHTGARYFAGFDFRNQFSWLDVSLEWGGDQIYARKRQHNGDDVVNLIDAIAAACETERTVITTYPEPTPMVAALLRKLAGPGPLVCVHPTVGNDARQWPIEYFAAVIDRLVETDGAGIVLIGAPGDEDVADEIIARVRRRTAVTSLVGQLSLSELPALLAGVSLFLGNNSGPKHIAAGLGVPTVGIHSGTEDVLEWGPVGPQALAVARDVVCAPCYLAEAADCRRGLACLRELEPARVYEACKRLLLLDGARRPATRPVDVDGGQIPRPANRPRRTGRSAGRAAQPSL